MNEKDIIKYFDLVIKNLDDVFAFSINNILFDVLKPESKEDKDEFFIIVDKVKYFGNKNKYFEGFGKNDGGWYKLTDKGIRLKDSNKGHLKFNRKSKSLDWYKITAIGLTLIFGCLNIYQKYDYNQLKSKYNSLKVDYDSIAPLKLESNSKNVSNKASSAIDTLQTRKSTN